MRVVLLLAGPGGVLRLPMYFPGCRYLLFCARSLVLLVISGDGVVCRLHELSWHVTLSPENLLLIYDKRLYVQ
jgi:hypothetical protein